MTRDEAFEKLRCGNQHERFRGAYYLMQVAREEDLIPLLKLHHLETDSFVKRRIFSVIEFLNTRKKNASREKPIKSAHKDDQMSKFNSVEWTVNMLLHEVGSKLGLIAVSAAREISDPEKSSTLRRIKHLQTTFNAITQLKSVNSIPIIAEFDLADLINCVISEESEGKNLEIMRVGIKPFMVKGDRNFIEMCLCNGLRNAIEAIADTVRVDEKQDATAKIIVSWDKTSSDYWISIIDKGPGLPDKNLFNEAGKSLKTGHSGYGLQIAKQAIERLNGSLSLSSSEAGGATFLIRWPSV